MNGQDDRVSSRRARGIAAALIVLVVAAVGTQLYRRLIPSVRRLELPDRTLVWIRRGSQLRVAADFPNSRAVDIDGEMVFSVPASARPLRIRSPLMIVTVTEPALLVVTSFAKDVGAHVEVIKGAAIVERAYPSRWQESEHMVAGEIALLSREIDLMEHEHTRAGDVPEWTRGVPPMNE